MKKFLQLVLPLALCTQLFAEDIKITGTIDQALKVPSQSLLNKTKHVTLLKMQINHQGLLALNDRVHKISSATNQYVRPSSLPTQVNLGMNNVPVLDQGMHGTCVTFANTAAVNAVLNHGDYISQLCQLQLGNYFEENGYLESGWDGTFGRYVLHQMETFGVVSKNSQSAVGCGGLTTYPGQDENAPQTFISPEDYHKISEQINDRMSWSTLLDFVTSFDKVDTDKVLTDVKKSLSEKDRVTTGILLADPESGIAGAVGKHNAQNDSWILTPEIIRNISFNPNFGGHEMVITGYDDDAVAKDEQGREHKGLLTLRNSWGTRLGNQGDFYMSYDYFKVLVIEAQRIRAINPYQAADGGLSTAQG